VHGVVQLGGVTPTVLKLGRSARFFIPGIPGLDASFLSMKRLRSWTARFCTARGREDRGSAGWNCRRGCLIGPGVCQCGSHAIRMLHLRHWRSSSSCSPKRRAATASHCHQILRFRAQQVRLATRTGGMLMRHQSQPHATDHGQVRQLDLFDLPAPAGFDQPVPSWRGLPEETRRAVTEMLARLLLDHGRFDRCPIRTEAVNDV
jgi:hypothetical protein